MRKRHGSTRRRSLIEGAASATMQPKNLSENLFTGRSALSTQRFFGKSSVPECRMSARLAGLPQYRSGTSRSALIA